MLPFSSWYRELLVGNPFSPLTSSSCVLASADAVLRDHHDNLINCTRLPLMFDITGKGKRPANPLEKAQRRAVRGVPAQQRSKYCAMHLNNLRAPKIYTYNAAPGITPVVPHPARHTQQTNESVLRLFSPPTSGNGGQQPSLVDITAEILPAVDPLFWDLPSLPFNTTSFITTSASQHVVQPSELGSNPHGMGKVFL